MGTTTLMIYNARCGSGARSHHHSRIQSSETSAVGRAHPRPRSTSDVHPNAVIPCSHARHQRTNTPSRACVVLYMYISVVL